MRASGMLSSHSTNTGGPEHLVLLGKAEVTIGSDLLSIKALAEDLDGTPRRLPFPGERLIIEGRLYRVTNTRTNEIRIDRPLELEPGTPASPQVAASLELTQPQTTPCACLSPARARRCKRLPAPASHLLELGPHRRS